MDLFPSSSEETIYCSFDPFGKCTRTEWWKQPVFENFSLSNWTGCVVSKTMSMHVIQISLNDVNA
jgi:hypothetical protein